MDPTPTSLRIGMLCPGYPSGEPGDYRGIFVQQMAHHLKKRGHRLCVLTSIIRPGDPVFRRVDEAEEVHRFRFWSEGKLLIEYERIPPVRMATYMASALLTGRRIFGRFGCDVLHTHFLLPTGLIGAALGGWLGRPHVLSVHGSDVRLAQKKIMQPLARWTLRRCQAVTAAAAHQGEPLRALGLAEERLTRMPMGIAETFLYPEPSAEGRRPKSLICTRSLNDATYNISQLLRAMALVTRQDPAVTCTIAGEGPDRAALESLARELRLQNNVRFIGQTSPERLARLLREHVLYVSPSRHDGASVSLFEAMASGAYPVLSDIAANREWVSSGRNGRLFALGEPLVLSRVILDALAWPTEIEKVTRLNRETALRQFTWPALAERLEGLYRQSIIQGMKRNQA